MSSMLLLFICFVVLLKVCVPSCISRTHEENNDASCESDEDCDDDLFVNTNRPPVLQFSDESDSEDDEEGEDNNKDDEQDK